jgi:hypothetical protein
MGEAKRRKQKLGAEYGQPLGLTASARRDLIKNNLEQLLCQHYQACGYTDWIDNAYRPEVNPSPNSRNSQRDFYNLLDELVKHWQNTFNGEFSRSALQKAVKSILEDKPTFLTDFSTSGLNHSRAMEPIIPLPQARSYFRDLVENQQIQLAQHYILLNDVLTVLATEEAFSLLKQILLNEFNDVILFATEEQPAWLSQNIHPDGWIDLTEEVGFQASNRALLGLLTLLVTLPWENKLKTLL